MALTKKQSQKPAGITADSCERLGSLVGKDMRPTGVEIVRINGGPKVLIQSLGRVEIGGYLTRNNNPMHPVGGSKQFFGRSILGE